MKIPIFLFVLALCAPALAQDQIAPPVAPKIEPKSARHWEFTPDFARGQNQIAWRVAPHFEDALLVATLTDAGLTTGEVISFPDANGKTVAVLTTTFDKKGGLQKQELRDAQGRLLTQNKLAPTAELSVPGSVISLRTVVEKGLLKRRIFLLQWPGFYAHLDCDYDARARREAEVWIEQNKTQPEAVVYNYDAHGLNNLRLSGIDAHTLSVERDATGQVRAMRVLASEGGLLQWFAAPVRDAKGNLSGTRIENYGSGILREITEIYAPGADAGPGRANENFTDRTYFENGKEITEKKFEFSVEVGGAPKTKAKTGARTKKHTVYARGLPVFEEIFKDGQLTERTDFNANGVAFKHTLYNADGSIASTFDLSTKSANGGFYIKPKMALPQTEQ